MTAAQTFTLTEAERGRVEHIDHLVALGGRSVDELIASMSDSSWTVRRAAVAGLAALGDDAVGPLCLWLRDARTAEHAIAAAVDALVASIGPTVPARVVDLLAHTDAAVVADAASILGRRRVATEAPRLAELLEHTDDNVAVAAIEALGAIGGTISIDALIDVLHRTSFFRTFPALQVLAKTGDPRVIAPIADLLADDGLRVEAARALGRTGSALAIAPLSSLLPRSSDTMARLVASALSDLFVRATWSGATEVVSSTMRAALAPVSGRFVAALRGSDALERVAIAKVLGTIGDADTMAVLVDLLGDPGVRSAATEAIRQIGSLHADALIEALSNGSTATRFALLPIVGTARAGESVRKLLTDEDPEIRARACEALGRIGDTASVPQLFLALGDRNPRVTYAATAAIHSLGIESTSTLAIHALAIGTTNVRRQALRIIAYLGCEAAFEPVQAAIEDPDIRIAELAVAALGALENPRVESILLTLARRSSDALRSATMRAAALRGGDVMAELLVRGLDDDAAWVRYYACQGLGRLGKSSSTAGLVSRLADAYPHVRIAAIEALARLDTPQAWQALTSAARSTDADEQRAALVGLSSVPRAAAVPFLLAAARSPETPTRLIALAGLAIMSDSRALDELAAAGCGEIVELRDAALSLLADSAGRPAADVLVDIVIATDADHPAHLTLSRPSPVRIHAISDRLAVAEDGTASILAAALARMAVPDATAALFGALSASSAPARRAAAVSLIAIDAPGAAGAVSRLASEDPDPDVRRACQAAVESR
jgi:HEAT repeat protein